MDIRKLQRAIVDGLEDVKAQHIVVFNTEHLSAMFERVIIASGTSNRQTKALAASVRDAVRGSGQPVLSVEGEDNGEWIIVDCGAAVVHIMQPAVREYYHLEEIWGGKPVKLKTAGAKTGLVKASEPMDDDEDDAPPAKKAARKAGAQAGAKAPAKTAARSAAPAKTAGRRTAPAPSAATPAAKTPARKSPAPSGAPAPRAATKPTAKTAAKAAAPKAPAKAASTTAAKTAGRTAAKSATKTAAKTAAKAPAKAPAKKAPAPKRRSTG